MLFSDFLVDIPDGSRYEIKKTQGNHYCYYRVESHRVNGKLRHKCFSIGKITIDEDGKKKLIPNDNYFKHMKLDLPSGSDLKLSYPGRKPLNKKNKYSELKDGSTLAFGYMIAIYHVAKELGLQEIIERQYGDQARNIITAGGYFAKADSMGLSGIEYFFEKNMCFTDSILTSQKLSKLYQFITQHDLDDFYKAWIKKNKLDDKSVCYDVTSISSYSEKLIYVSYGYNRDKEKLPQINLGLFCTLDEKGTGLPLYPSVYNGCINDFTNFPYVVAQGRRLGLKNIELVTDGGFAVDSAMKSAVENNFDFTMGAPSEFGISVGEDIEEWILSNDHSKDKVILIELDDGASSDGLISSQKNYEFFGKKCRLIMYRSNASAMAQTDSFTRMINKAEDDLTNAKTLTDPLKKKWEKYFNFQVNEDQSFSFSRNEDYIREQFQLLGTFAILTTNLKDSHETILRRYREKDVVEKAFDILKNDILSERLNISNNQSLKGKIMLAFLGLIFRKHILRNCK